MVDYSSYEYLDITVEDGIALVQITHPRHDMSGHHELNTIWRDLDRDHEVRSVLFTWADPPTREPGAHLPPDIGREAAARNPGKTFAAWQWPIRETRDGIRDLLDSNKMVVSALRGEVPYGTGLVLATLADVSIAGEDCVISDRHIARGIAPGNGAVYWAMMVGVQKAKYLALTSAEISGAEADRMGLVSLSLPDDQVMDKAWATARLFADGPQHAQNYTKKAFNQVHRLGGLVSFDIAHAYSILGLLADPDVAVCDSWGKVHQGGSRDYDLTERPPLPSTQNPYGPGELQR